MRILRQSGQYVCPEVVWSRDDGYFELWFIVFGLVLTIFDSFSQSSIRPSLCVSSIVKSRSNPFLELTSTKLFGDC